MSSTSISSLLCLDEPEIIDNQGLDCGRAHDESAQFQIPFSDQQSLHEQSGGDEKEAASSAYWKVRVDDLTAENAAWSYPCPRADLTNIRDYFAFYPSIFESNVDAERVEPQLGGFYGGWITRDLVGPFKGTPGSSGW